MLKIIGKKRKKKEEENSLSCLVIRTVTRQVSVTLSSLVACFHCDFVLLLCVYILNDWPELHSEL